MNESAEDGPTGRPGSAVVRFLHSLGLFAATTLVACSVAPPPQRPSEEAVEQYDLLRDAYTTLVRHVRSVQTAHEQLTLEAPWATNCRPHWIHGVELLAEHERALARIANQRTSAIDNHELARCQRQLADSFERFRTQITPRILAIPSDITTYCPPSVHAKVAEWDHSHGLWKLELSDSDYFEGLPASFGIHDEENYKGEMLALARRGRMLLAWLLVEVPGTTIMEGDMADTWLGTRH